MSPLKKALCVYHYFVEYSVNPEFAWSNLGRLFKCLQEDGLI
jgi:hypothetical protein